MRFLTADYLYPLSCKPIKKGVLQISDDGVVINIFSDRNLFLSQSLETFEGVLCPGFVNAHCHLELSHLCGCFVKGGSFLDFVSVVKKRDKFSRQEILSSIAKAESKMIENGIVAVGDICNSSDTILQKKNRNLIYYNFIEVFGVNDNKAEKILQNALFLKNKFLAAGLKSTICPHAPYSVPPKLMSKIKHNLDYNDDLISMHFQETEAENNLFINKKGTFFNWLNNINASPSIWESRSRPTQILNEIGKKKLMLVHNTFARKEDIGDYHYCTCPKSNLFIENQLPDYSLFNPKKLCVGTDSLASNDSLSILDELRVIKENSNFDLNTLFKIASKNGADALGFSSLGTFEKGKRPGVNLVRNLEEVEIIA